MSEPLVWLPFAVDGLPAGVRVEVIPEPAEAADPGDVEFFVLPYRFDPGDLDVVDRMPRLRVVQSLMAGTEHLAGRIPDGVTLCNARGVHSSSTAELALTLILASLRGVPEFVRAQDRHEWVQGFRPALADKRVLIVGYGDIGAALEGRLVACEAEVVRVARRARDGVHAIGDLSALLPEVDVVVLLVPLTDETRHLVDADFLGAMKPGALLVNVARGGVVDTDALVTALRERRVMAALDVFESEPLPADHPLWRAPGALISPHVGGPSSAFRPRADRLIREQLARFVAGEPLTNSVAE